MKMNKNNTVIPTAAIHLARKATKRCNSMIWAFLIQVASS